MALMGTLRNKTHFILWFLLVTFIGSLAVGGFVGGADILDVITGKADYFDAVAIVNGDQVKTEDYYNILNFRYDQLRDQGIGEITEDMRVQLGNEVWTELVTETIMRQEIERREIPATNGEVIWQMRENPPDYFRRDTVFQTDGKFDIAKYRQFLNDPNNNWRVYENDVRNALPRQKMLYLLASTIRVSDEDVQEHYKMNRLRYHIRYLTINNTKFMNDPSTRASDEEIAEWYNAHKDDYRTGAGRIMKYASFSKQPTAEDTSAVVQEAIELKNRTEAGAKFDELARAYSDGPSASAGGDLGFFGKGVMVKEFEDAAFSGNVGDVIAPVHTKFGVHVIQITEKRTKSDGSVEIKASHILLEINAGPNSLANSRSNANLFAFDARDLGFEAASESNNVTIQQTELLNEFDLKIENIGSLNDAVLFSFRAKEGDISEIYENENGYYVFQLEEIFEENIQPLSEVEQGIKAVIESRHQSNRALLYAQELYENAKKSELSLENIAGADEEIKIKSTPAFTLASHIPGIGKSGILSGVLSQLDPGEIAEPVLVNASAVIAELIDKESFDQKAFETAQAEIRRELMNEQNSNIFNKWMDDLKVNSKVEDLRNIGYEREFHNHL